MATTDITRLQTSAWRDRAATDPKERNRQLREVSQAFAGVYLNQLMKSMRATVPEGTLGHGGSAERMFQGMADEEMAMKMAEGGAWGLADVIYRSLLPRTGSEDAPKQAVTPAAARAAYAAAHPAAPRLEETR